MRTICYSNAILAPVFSPFHRMLQGSLIAVFFFLKWRYFVSTFARSSTIDGDRAGSGRSIDGAYLSDGMRARKWRAGKNAGSRFWGQEGTWPRIYVANEPHGSDATLLPERMKILVRIPVVLCVWGSNRQERRDSEWKSVRLSDRIISKSFARSLRVSRRFPPRLLHIINLGAARQLQLNTRSFATRKIPSTKKKKSYLSIVYRSRKRNICTRVRSD